jgi:hypothetical protein
MLLIDSNGAATMRTLLAGSKLLKTTHRFLVYLPLLIVPLLISSCGQSAADKAANRTSFFQIIDGLMKPCDSRQFEKLTESQLHPDTHQMADDWWEYSEAYPDNKYFRWVAVSLRKPQGSADIFDLDVQPALDVTKEQVREHYKKDHREMESSDDIKDISPMRGSEQMDMLIYDFGDKWITFWFSKTKPTLALVSEYTSKYGQASPFSESGTSGSHSEKKTPAKTKRSKH